MSFSRQQDRRHVQVSAGVKICSGWEFVGVAAITYYEWSGIGHKKNGWLCFETATGEGGK